MRVSTRGFLAVLLVGTVAAGVGRAGHSRSSYVDGRFVVTAQLVQPEDERAKLRDSYWQFTWRDRKTDQTRDGKLVGLRSGLEGVAEQVHAHIFVAPDGATFAVWNCRATALHDGAIKKANSNDPRDDAFQNHPGFAHRLVIYRNTGEIVKSLALKDFVRGDEWNWLWPFGSQVFWLAEYPGLSYRGCPRSDYCFYQISPDYTVLEFQIAPWHENKLVAEAKMAGKPLPPPRTVRVSLTDGRILTEKETPTDPNQIPTRPFRGEASPKGGQSHYLPSLDPVRVEGQFGEAAAK
jgi:hypothetical protein